MRKKLKKLPNLRSDKAAEKFVAESDLTKFDLSDMKMVQFEFQPKTGRLNMRLPEALIKAAKARAQQAGIPYQRFIRLAIEKAVQNPKV